MAEIQGTEKRKKQIAGAEDLSLRYRLLLARRSRYAAARRAARILLPLSPVLPAAVLAIMAGTGGFPGDHAVLLIALSLALTLAGGAAFSAFLLPLLFPEARAGQKSSSFLLAYARFLARRELNAFIVSHPEAANGEFFRFSTSLTAGYIPGQEERLLLESGPAEIAEEKVRANAFSMLSAIYSDSCKDNFAFVLRTEAGIRSWYRRESGLYLPKQQEEIRANAAYLVQVLCAGGRLADLMQTTPRDGASAPPDPHTGRTDADPSDPVATSKQSPDDVIRYITSFHPELSWGGSVPQSAGTDSPGCTKERAMRDAKRTKDSSAFAAPGASAEGLLLPTRTTVHRYIDLVKELDTLTSLENFLRLDRDAQENCRRLLGEYRSLRSSYFFADLPAFRAEETERRLEEADRDAVACWHCHRPYNPRHKTVCSRCGHPICPRCGSCYCKKYIVRSAGGAGMHEAARPHAGSGGGDSPSAKENRFSPR